VGGVAQVKKRKRKEKAVVFSLKVSAMEHLIYIINCNHREADYRLRLVIPVSKRSGTNL
jgi:hypothetical protein